MRALKTTLRLDVLRWEWIVDKGHKFAVWVRSLEFRGLIDDFIGPFMDVSRRFDPLYVHGDFDGLALRRIGRVDFELFPRHR